MSADNYYDDLNNRLAGGSYCDRESTEDECNEAIALGAEQEECSECGHVAHEGLCGYERGDMPGDGEHAAMAYPPCPCEFSERRADLIAAIEQEQIIEASRSVRAGTDMLFAALRKARVL